MVKLKQPMPKKKIPLPGGSGPSKPPPPKSPDVKSGKAPPVGGGGASPTATPMSSPKRPPEKGKPAIDAIRDFSADMPPTISLAEKRAMQELLARPRNEELQYLVDPEAQRVLRYVRRMPGIVDAALRIAKSPKAAFEFLLADGIALADEVIARLLAAEGIDLTPWQSQPDQPDPCPSDEWWCSAPVVHIELKSERELTWEELAARLGIPVEALRMYNGAITGPIPPGATVALPVPGLRLHYSNYGGFRESWMGPVYVSAEPGRTLFPYDDMSPWSVATLQLMWQDLSLLEIEIEFALALTAESAQFAPFDNVRTFDETMDWITGNSQNIAAISARFDVEPSLVAGILASEMLYDYSTFDVIPDSLGLEMFGWGNASGYASVHDETLKPAYEHLEGIYGENNPWTQDPNTPSMDEDPSQYELTDIGAITAAAVVARYYVDHYVDFQHHTEAETSMLRHALTPEDEAVIFGAYRAGVKDIEPYGIGFDSMKQFREAAQNLGANALLALPLMRHFEEVFP